MSNGTTCSVGKGGYACVPEFPKLDPPTGDSKIPSRKKNDLPIDRFDRYPAASLGSFSLITHTMRSVSNGFWISDVNNDSGDNLKLGDNNLRQLEPGTIVPLMGSDGNASKDSPKEKEPGCGTGSPKREKPKKNDGPCGPAGGGGDGCY